MIKLNEFELIVVCHQDSKEVLLLDYKSCNQQHCSLLIHSAIKLTIHDPFIFLHVHYDGIDLWKPITKVSASIIKCL